jgi:hypothetical protein
VHVLLLHILVPVALTRAWIVVLGHWSARLQGPLHAPRGAVRRTGPCGRPLTEDDVIAFGLELERTEDVVRAAVSEARSAPHARRARRDVAGPS